MGTKKEAADHELGGHQTDESLPPAPKNNVELQGWLREHLGVNVPCLAQGSADPGPLGYLCHTFFEGQLGLPTGSPPGPIDCIVWANRGGGKTFLGAVATALDLLYKPGIQVRILGGSLEQSQRMHAHLVDLFSRGFLAEHTDGRITGRRVRLKNGSRAEVMAQSPTSVRGTRVQKIRCDEVELFDPQVWEAAQLATRSAVCGGRPVRGAIECLSTMHVPHGLMSRLLTQGGRRLFKWGLVDVLSTCGDDHKCNDPAVHPGAEPCPLWQECRGRARQGAGHISIDDAIAMKGRVDAAMWESEMLCLRPRRSDTVLPEFDPAVHVVEQLPFDPSDPALRWLAGMDFGFRAPTVVLWAALNPLDRLWIVAERSVAGITLDGHIAAIKESPWPAPEWIGIDPAGRQADGHSGRTDESVLRDAGLFPRVRQLGIQPGLSLIRARLRPASGPPRLMIHSRCRSLIRSLERYHYDPRRPESADPVKDGSDHAVDALRYLLANLDRPHRLQIGNYTH